MCNLGVHTEAMSSDAGPQGSVLPAEIAAWCESAFGVAPVTVLLVAGHLSRVYGVELADASNLGVLVNHQPEVLVEKVQHLGLVPGESADEHAAGGITGRSDGLADPGATPDPAVSEPPVVVCVSRLVDLDAAAALPESQVIRVEGDQAAP